MSELASTPDLTALDFDAGPQVVAEQAQQIIRLNPLPRQASFLYFGLFDTLERDKKSSGEGVGCYFAGGESLNPEDALDGGDLSYFPEQRLLNVEILNRVKEFGRNVSGARQLVDYALLFGATAILLRMQSLI